MLDYYDRIMSIYIPAAELYYVCTRPQVRIITSTGTNLPPAGEGQPPAVPPAGIP